MRLETVSAAIGQGFRAAMAIEDIKGGGKHEFDDEFCKGCGLCVKECPCRYIQLTLEK